MASKIKVRCTRIRYAHSAYTDKDGHSAPCKGFIVFFNNIEEQSGPQWGVAEIIFTVLHECHYVVGQKYEFEV